MPGVATRRASARRAIASRRAGLLASRGTTPRRPSPSRPSRTLLP